MKSRRIIDRLSVAVFLCALLVAWQILGSPCLAQAQEAPSPAARPAEAAAITEMVSEQIYQAGFDAIRQHLRPRSVGNLRFRSIRKLLLRCRTLLRLLLRRS